MFWRSWKLYGAKSKICNWAPAHLSTPASLNLPYMNSGADLRGGVEDSAFSGLGWLLPVCRVFLLLHSGYWFSLVPAQMDRLASPRGWCEVYLPYKHKTTVDFPSLAWLELLSHERIAAEHLALCFPHSVSLTTWEWPSVRTQRGGSYSIPSGLQG